ncbi:FAD-binding oxidoreductase [Acidovorax sp. JHL-3]|uniref:NAD(P)/FAD-dependent oxidoreductase n=1 Tax=Acidovorax sp. JHL-3 TaxID=1276755 RepID=UPI000464E425|nr:FAD-dependent oxidoreductase [Acidovorax sp. JHL-3]
MSTTPTPIQTDFLIIGAGIAGASVGYWLAPHGKVVILERESQPGYHSTGRSAALYMASYGSEQVRGLTRASLDFFQNPPSGFTDYPLLKPRGAMMVATAGQLDALNAHWKMLSALDPHAQFITGEDACAKVPILRANQVVAAVYEPDAYDMDVDAIHSGFLKGIRRAGGKVQCNAQVTAMQRQDNAWVVTAGEQSWTAPVVINAAGAWADDIGQLAGAQRIGLVPCRRSAFVFPAPPGCNTEHWPMVIGASEDWYLKPDAGMLLGSPANADPVQPQDIQPEELDIAMGIARIGEMTNLEIRRPTRTWAGLRSFVADGGLVGGPDAQAPGFFWVAGQGGYGIQTCAAMGEACAALVRGLPVPQHIQRQGVTETALSPQRLLA